MSFGTIKMLDYAPRPEFQVRRCESIGHTRQRGRGTYNAEKYLQKDVSPLNLGAAAGAKMYASS